MASDANASSFDLPPMAVPFADWTPRVPVGPKIETDLLAGVLLSGDTRKAKTRIDADWAAVTGQLAVRDPDWVRDDPLHRGNSWSTGETLRLPLNDAIYLFGAMDAESKSVEQQQFRWLGKTGVGLKLRPWWLEEVQLRGGPARRYVDEDRSVHNPAAEQSELFVEVSTKLPVPLLRAIQLEYTGTAIPPTTSAERERIKQNFKIALPLSDSSQFHVGASWRSDETSTPTPFIDRAQLYFGVQLNR
jgi:hypothetical protein